MSFKKYCKYIAWATGVIILVAIGFLMPNIWGAVKALGYYDRGQKLTEAGEYEAAIEKFAQALEIQPDNVEAFAGKITALEKLGKSKEILKQCQRRGWICRYP